MKITHQMYHSHTVTNLHMDESLCIKWFQKGFHVLGLRTQSFQYDMGYVILILIGKIYHFIFCLRYRVPCHWPISLLTVELNYTLPSRDETFFHFKNMRTKDLVLYFNSQHIHCNKIFSFWKIYLYFTVNLEKR